MCVHDLYQQLLEAGRVGAQDLVTCQGCRGRAAHFSAQSRSFLRGKWNGNTTLLGWASQEAKVSRHAQKPTGQGSRAHPPGSVLPIQGWAMEGAA